MRALGLQTIDIAAIDAGDRLRQVDEAHAELLAQNMRESGLRQPIEVRARKGQPYALIAGGHRLRAAVRLGWTEIDAFVFEMSADEARLAEIDENLVRHDLNPLDRAVFLAERKAVYERLHPETKNGAQGGRGGKKNEMDTMSFSNDTAERCGWTRRTIDRAVFIASKLPAETRARIAGSPLAKNQSELLALARLGPDLQGRVLDLVLSGQARNVGAGERLARGIREFAADSLSAFKARWARLPQRERDAILDWLHETGAISRFMNGEGEAA